MFYLFRRVNPLYRSRVVVQVCVMLVEQHWRLVLATSLRIVRFVAKCLLKLLAFNLFHV